MLFNDADEVSCRARATKCSRCRASFAPIRSAVRNRHVVPPLDRQLINPLSEQRTSEYLQSVFSSVKRLNEYLESRGLQFFHEIVDAIGGGAGRKEILHRYPQHFGQVEQRLVIHVRQAGFNFRDAASADVESRKLELGRKIGLRPPARLSVPAHLRTNVVFEAHVRSGLALFALRLCGCKAQPRRALDLAELDELRGVAPGQCIRSFVAEIRPFAHMVLR